MRAGNICPPLGQVGLRSISPLNSIIKFTIFSHKKFIRSSIGTFDCTVTFSFCLLWLLLKKSSIKKNCPEWHNTHLGGSGVKNPNRLQFQKWDIFREWLFGKEYFTISVVQMVLELKIWITSPQCFCCFICVSLTSWFSP